MYKLTLCLKERRCVLEGINYPEAMQATLTAMSAVNENTTPDKWE